MWYRELHQSMANCLLVKRVVERALSKRGLVHTYAVLEVDLDVVSLNGLIATLNIQNFGKLKHFRGLLAFG